jgi:hypothetical protein
LLNYEVSGNEVLITPQIGEDGDGGQWAQAVTAAANGASVRVDTGLSPRLSMASVCELVGLVRVARRARAVVDHRPLSSSLTEQLCSIGLATYLAAAEATP